MAGVAVQGVITRRGFTKVLAARLRAFLHGGRRRTAGSSKESDRPRPPEDAVKTQLIVLGANAQDDGSIAELGRRGNELVRPGRRRVILDLTRVEGANTRLVASLVALVRRARLAGVRVDIRVSRRVREWLAHCRVERLLDPYLREPGDA